MAENADFKTGVRHGGGAPSTPPQSQSSGSAVAGARILRPASAGGLRRNSGRSASQVLHVAQLSTASGSARTALISSQRSDVRLTVVYHSLNWCVHEGSRKLCGEWCICS